MSRTKKIQHRHMVIPRTLIFIFHKKKLLLIKYSGKNTGSSEEKSIRKDIYNAIGGHIEKDEDVIENAIKETKEEAGITLLHPKVKGFINVQNFAGKDVALFLITGKTNTSSTKDSIEGTVTWVALDNVHSLNTFTDFPIILEKLLSLKKNQMIVGKSVFDGEFGLKEIQLEVY